MLGIPEHVGEAEATKKGYTIPSEGLAMILKAYFTGCEQQAGLDQYIQEVMQQSGATIEHLAREFRLGEKDLRKFME